MLKTLSEAKPINHSEKMGEMTPQDKQRYIIPLFSGVVQRNHSKTTKQI